MVCKARKRKQQKQKYYELSKQKNKPAQDVVEKIEKGKGEHCNVESQPVTSPILSVKLPKEWRRRQYKKQWRKISKVGTPVPASGKQSEANPNVIGSLVPPATARTKHAQPNPEFGKKASECKRRQDNRFEESSTPKQLMASELDTGKSAQSSSGTENYNAECNRDEAKLNKTFPLVSPTACQSRKFFRKKKRWIYTKSKVYRLRFKQRVTARRQNSLTSRVAVCQILLRKQTLSKTKCKSDDKAEPVTVGSKRKSELQRPARVLRKRRKVYLGEMSKVYVAKLHRKANSKFLKPIRPKRDVDGAPKGATTKRKPESNSLCPAQSKKKRVSYDKSSSSKASTMRKADFSLPLRARRLIVLSNVRRRAREGQTNPTFKKLNVYSLTRLKRKVFHLSWREPLLVNMLTAHCVGPPSIVRVRVQSLVKWCLVARKELIGSFLKEQRNLVSRCENRIQVAKLCHSKEERREAFLGTSLHSSSTEGYFPETSYEPGSVASSRSVKDKDGKLDEEFIVKTFPGACQPENKKGFRWQCGSMCRKVSLNAFKIVRQTFRKLSKATLPAAMIYFLREMNDCKNSECRQSNKRGHCLSCRENVGNTAPLVIMQNIMPHFPEVRAIVRSLQSLKGILHKIDDLDTALYQLHVDKLQKVADAQKLKGGEFKIGTSNSYDNEESVIAKYVDSFSALNHKMNDLPTNYCFSCERLLSLRQSMCRVSNLRSIPNNQHWNKALQRARNLGVSTEFICDWCLRKYRANQLPPIACLNKLEVPEVPLCIRKLSNFDLKFISRASSYQVISKMGTVSGKNIPAANRVSKVTGTTFHLPLPLEQTIEKILKPHQAVMPNPDFYILVRGQPTKQRKIWESLMNVHEILECLPWLKKNNHLYFKIQFSNSAQDLLNCLEKEDGGPDNPEPPNSSEDLNSQNVDDPEPLGSDNSAAEDPADRSRVDDEAEDAGPELLSPNTCPTRKGDTDSDAQPQNPHHTAAPDGIAAMITQLKKDDASHEHYTIVPVYDKRQNKSASEQYQMKKVEGESLDSKAPFLDAMCFPALYPYGNNCLNDERSVPLEFSDFVKAKLLSRHSQFRKDIQYLFFLLNQKTMRQLSSGIYQILYITRQKLTAGEFLKGVEPNGDLERDFSNVFRSIPNTEQYWKVPRSQIFCMIENLGPPTFFLTLSPADYDDKELLHFLCQVNGKEATGKSLSALVPADPIATSRFYEQKLHAMLDFLTAPNGPLGPIEHYVWRREYQGRGTQHFHILLWVRGAPVIGEATSEEVAKFIQEHIVCSIPDKAKFPDLYSKVTKYQDHRCNSYCLRYKKSKKIKICRFGFPRPVTDKLILRDVATAIAGRRNLSANSRLYDLPRKENEQRTNDYNIPIMLAWCGNCDIQFVKENSCVIGRYISKYQTKPEKSHMTDVFDDINSTKSVASRLWNIGLRGLSNRECGALEAADVLLGHPLYGTDRNTSIKWIDVGTNRSRKVKPRNEVEQLDSNADPFCASLIDTHYPNRPGELDNVCLYDYVKYWDIIKIKPSREPVPKFYEYPNFGYLRERSLKSKPPVHPHLINYWHYDPNQKPEEYFRSMLLLFKPWRKIDEDLRGRHTTWTAAFEAEKASLQDGMKHHEKLSLIRAADEAMKSRIDEKTNNLQNEERKKKDDDQEGPLLDGVEEVQGHIRDMRAAADADITETLAELIAKMNPDQKRAFLDIINTLLAQREAKKQQTPQSVGKVLRRFISGVGGTGKSFLIKAIRLWVRQELGMDVILAAPTGIAAYGINGFTLHKILQLPVEHNGVLKYTRLNDAVLNVLRAELKNTAIFIIDEGSMVSNIMLAMIHLRLSEIYDTFDEEDAFFGNMNMLIFGDLLQLNPVKANPPFVRLSTKECEKHFPSMSSFNLWELFDYDELQINMRQKTDKKFCDLLANVRLGFVSEENMATLQSRQIKFEGSTPLERRKELAQKILQDEHEGVCLLPTRKMCNALNATVLSLIEGEEIELKAEDSLPRGVSKQKVERKMKKFAEDSHLTADLDAKIVIKVGARIMLKRNIDVTKGFVNGATGTVLSVSYDGPPNPNRLPTSILIQMKNDTLNLKPVKAKFQVLPRAYVWRTQFPITLAYAMTDHKGQGLTLKSIYVDCGNSIFSCGQIYVALSRVETLEGLHIINFDPSQVKAQPGAIKEYTRLRSMAPWLQHQTMEVPKQRKKPQKVKDIVWATFDVSVNVADKTPSPKKSKAPLLPPFENIDKASDYANAVLQCLLSYEPLRSSIKSSAREDAMKKIASQFSLTRKKLSAYGARQMAGSQFAEATRKDPAEFISSLLDQNDTLLHSYTWFIERHVTRCDSCDAESEKSVRTSVLQVPIIDPNEKNITRLLEKKLSHWSPIANARCASCHRGNSFTRVSEILEPNDMLVVQLQLWKTLDDQPIKNTRFRINYLPSTILTVGGNNYKLHSVLFHHGPSIEHGHCTAIVRSGKKFILADDTRISECSWPRGSADAYLLFYVSIDGAVKHTEAQAIRQKWRSTIPSEVVPGKNARRTKAAQNPKKPPIKRNEPAPRVTITTKQTPAQVKPPQAGCRRELFEVPHAKTCQEPVVVQQRTMKPVETLAPCNQPVISSFVKTTAIPMKSEASPLPPFQNTDGVSCYANASLQSLLSHEPLRHAVSVSAEGALQNIARQYSHPRITLSAKGVREYAGSVWTELRQQDAQEFLMYLIEQNGTLQDYTSFYELHETKCFSCSHEGEARIVPGRILSLPVKLGEKNITHYLENNFAWSLNEERKCLNENCENGSYSERACITHASDIFIIHFKLFKWDNIQRISKKITGFEIDNLASTEITVGDNRYQLHAVIIHYGACVNTGHYKAAVRKGNKFFLADDDKITELLSLPNEGGEVYLVLYRKIQ